MQSPLYSATIHFDLWTVVEKQFWSAESAGLWCIDQTAGKFFRYYQVIRLHDSECKKIPAKKPPKRVDEKPAT